MHTLWKGSISFGLVNVPIKMHAATDSHDFQFNYLHKECHNRIKYSKRCPVCDVEVSSEDLVKGYEFEKGRFVVISDEDLEAVAKPMSRSIDILDFIDLAEIDPIYYQKSYYLSPEETAQKAYRLLCAAMEETGKVALARVILRSKQHLACLRVFEGSLVMETMYYPDEIRHMDAVWKDIQPTATELEMAKQLIEQLARPFNPDQYHDETRAELREMIESKITGQVYEAEPAIEKGKVLDLMEALRLSIARNDQSHDQSALPSEQESVERSSEQAGEQLTEPTAADPSVPQASDDVEADVKGSLTPRKRARRRVKGA